MKKSLLFALTAALLLFSAVNCFAESVAHDADFVEIKAILGYNESLSEEISGLCFGDGTACVYSSSSYALLDTNAGWNVISAFQLDHLDLETNDPSVVQALYENGIYHLLVFDRASEKSYIVSHIDGQPEYSALTDLNACSFIPADGGYFLTGTDANQQIRYLRTNETGKIIWDMTDAGDLPVFCAARGENLLVVRQSSSENKFTISVLSSGGEKLSDHEIHLDNVESRSAFQTLHASVTENEILLSGEHHSGSECHGFLLRLSDDFSILEYREPEQFQSIPDFISTSNQTLLLAVTNPDSSLPAVRYLLAETVESMSLQPLETAESNFQTTGLQADGNHIYIYGRTMSSDSFIGELKENSTGAKQVYVTRGTQSVALTVPDNYSVEDEGDLGITCYLDSLSYITAAIPRGNLSGTESLAENINDSSKIVRLRDDLHVCLMQSESTLNVIELGLNLPDGTGLILSVTEYGNKEIYQGLITMLNAVTDTSELQSWLQESGLLPSEGTAD